jgi:hypothetical protein
VAEFRGFKDLGATALAPEMESHEDRQVRPLA